MGVAARLDRPVAAGNCFFSEDCGDERVSMLSDAYPFGLSGIDRSGPYRAGCNRINGSYIYSLRSKISVLTLVQICIKASTKLRH